MTPPNPSFSAKLTASSKETFLDYLFFITRSSLLPTNTIFLKLIICDYESQESG